MDSDAIRSAWHFIEDAYGVGELCLLMTDGTLIKICNDNSQQLLEVWLGQGEDVMVYTHIESWLSETDKKILQNIVNVTTKNKSTIHMHNINICPKRRRSSEITQALSYKRSKIT